MFTGFANVWTPALHVSALAKGPVRLLIAGEPIVLFRANGQYGALIDRCPHRGVALSLGKVKDGCLECPFHGWRFAPDGSNQRVPLNPDAKREQLGATALPVRLIGEMLWIYTAPGVAAPTSPNVPEGLSAPHLARDYLTRDCNSHWTRVMENMLDSAHLPFVHAKTIGARLKQQLREDSRMDIAWRDTPWGGQFSASLDGGESAGALEFYRPNIMALHIPVPGRFFRLHAIVTPIDENRTRLTIVGARNFLRWRIFNPLFNGMNARIADEDRAVVESSDPPEAPPLGVERSVRTDRATLQFRKYYHDVLRGSRSEARAA